MARLIVFLSIDPFIVLPGTTSLTTKSTEPCVCCHGKTAVRSPIQPSDVQMFRLSKSEGDIEIDFVECHVCGYGWYEIDVEREEVQSVVNVVHDVTMRIPGQPINGAVSSPAPSCLVTAKPTDEVMVDRIGDINSWMSYYFFPAIPGAERKPMTKQAFQNELNRRFRERRAVACN